MRLVVSFLAAITLLSPLSAQDVTAMLNGTVRDASGAEVPNATVTVTNDATGAKRSVSTNTDGYFSVTDLQIGSYSVSVELRGFKTYRQHGIELTAGQIRRLGDIRMAIGDVAESVTVVSETATVALASGEKASVITADDLAQTAIRGRDYLDMLRLQPGVVDENDSREAPGPDGIRNLYINGARENQKNITIDGVTVQGGQPPQTRDEIGRASCRERV